MRSLIKICFVVFICLYSIQTSAQSIRLQGGLNLANILEKDNAQYYGYNYQYNPGFHVGLGFAVPISGRFAIEYGFYISKKGARIKLKSSTTNLTNTLNTYYFDVPLILKSKHNIGNGKTINFGFGTYFGVGLAGHTRAIGYNQTGAGTVREEISWGNQDKAVLRRLDQGIIFMLGFEYKKYTLDASYDLGIMNISPYRNQGELIKNRVIKFSLGYRIFGKS